MWCSKRNKREGQTDNRTYTFIHALITGKHVQLAEIKLVYKKEIIFTEHQNSENVTKIINLSKPFVSVYTGLYCTKVQTV